MKDNSLQCCFGFCHTTTLISHMYTSPPSWASLPLPTQPHPSTLEEILLIKLQLSSSWQGHDLGDILDRSAWPNFSKNPAVSLKRPSPTLFPHLRFCKEVSVFPAVIVSKQHLFLVLLPESDSAYLTMGHWALKRLWWFSPEFNWDTSKIKKTSVRLDYRIYKKMFFTLK